MYSRLHGYEEIDLELVCPNFRTASEIEKTYPKGYYDRKLVNVSLTALSICPFIKSFAVNKTNLELVTRSLYKDFCPDNYKPSMFASDFISNLTKLPVTERELWNLYAKTGCKPYFLTATEKAEIFVRNRFKNKKYITITCRNTPHNSDRNVGNNLVDAVRGIVLKRFQNLDVVIIPDQDDLFYDRNFESLKNCWVEAALDLDIRQAFYSDAVCNISFATGPIMLLVFSENPYLILGTYNEKSRVSNKDFFDRKGPFFDKQRPWATEKQVTDWTEVSELESEDVLCRIVNTYLDSFADNL